MRDYSKFTGNNNPNFKTGYKKTHPSLYNSWQNMKRRCLKETHPKYYRYGGRGIKICDDWMDVKKFGEWALSHGWKHGYTIDRIDNDGNYCPENCRWISKYENSRHKRTTKIDLLTAQEIRSRINENWYDLAKEYNCTHGNIWFIMHNFTHVPDGECSKKIKERYNNANNGL